MEDIILTTIKKQRAFHRKLIFVAEYVLRTFCSALWLVTAGKWQKRDMLKILRINRPLSPKPHSLSAPVIVSLTSYPPRFSVLPLTLECLLTQTVLADKIILWIAHKDMNRLTPEILEFKNRGIEIKSCEDLRSYKKLIPTLQESGEAVIVTADDDAYYWSTWLEELVGSWEGDRNEIIANRVKSITTDSFGMPNEYKKWENGEGNDAEINKKSFLNFATGIGGILYPPGSLHKDVLKTEVFERLVPHNDDIWFYWMARLNGSKVKRLRGNFEALMWPMSQKTALWKYNVEKGGNDEQIKNMIEFYGFPHDN
ncbi:MAG: hypothetical protein PHO92_04685 [Candidatus Peribacteraceae bacterium]|nr:hypothetical protein [Candidatus Peribacteraceae bacterium]